MPRLTLPLVLAIAMLFAGAVWPAPFLLAGRAFAQAGTEVPTAPASSNLLFLPLTFKQGQSGSFAVETPLPAAPVEVSPSTQGIPTGTDTPLPATPSATPLPENTPLPTLTPNLTPTLTPVPITATPLPPNPGQVNSLEIGSALGMGALGVIGIFAVLGVYASLRRVLRRE